MVGDVHRTLLYGGIFGYPADKQNPDGAWCAVPCRAVACRLCLGGLGDWGLVGFGGVAWRAVERKEGWMEGWKEGWGVSVPSVSRENHVV
jgi:hypothetical protein